MSASALGSATVKVLALGSSHADDQLGWRCVELLRPQLPLEIPVLSLSQPLDLVDHARGCERLFLIDAAAGDGPPGSIVRLRWPDPRIEAAASASSHGLGLPEALRLAESLGCLPREVIVFAMYFEQIRGTLRLSQRVAAALPELARRILAEVGRTDNLDPAKGG